MIFMPKINSFKENNPEMEKNFSQGPPWVTEKILRNSGSATFLVKLPDG